MSIFSSWVTSPGAHRPVELELPLAPPAPSAQLDDGVTFVDRGMELPESYDIDTVRVLVQDPFHLMVYWELKDESFRSLGDVFPVGGSNGFRPTLRLSDLDGGAEAYVAVPLAGKYWFAVTPGRRYRVDFGALSDTRGFVPIIRSNVAETPRGTVSPTIDEDPKYRIDTPRFVRLLQVTGFASDRVLTDVALAEANVAGGDSPRFLAVQPPQHLVDAFRQLPDAVRTAASVVARGERLSRRLIESLPESLREVLERYLNTDDEELLSAIFMHLLPQLLREAMEGELVSNATQPFHVAPRHMLGSSEEIQRRRHEWSWLPSMTERLSRLVPSLEPDALDAESNGDAA